ncbi:hypothetical protein MettiDRAFT_2415 [Methanolobus tindarius DSM 2278]|uniref:Uncharacterized protein n=1 Tax=Methanolobus tindarius DSM 2278 TaxID=1090322 RepID=W9DZY3_METTI|nr:hypothetical protein [Methanolobus tindarius]ETA68926.1 hypothetical protein MettiDRAFT_2415 [Methanolobus tindarius DSM 2278]
MDINSVMEEKPDTKVPMIFSVICGSLYIIMGLLQLAAGTGKIILGSEFSIPLSNVLFVPADIIGSFVLLLIGTVFIYGVLEMRSGVYEGISYAYVGILLALIFAFIYLLVCTGNLLETHLLMNEEFEGWTPLSDMSPGIYLAILPLFAYIKWKDIFEPVPGTNIRVDLK